MFQAGSVWPSTAKFLTTSSGGNTLSPFTRSSKQWSDYQIRGAMARNALPRFLIASSAALAAAAYLPAVTQGEMVRVNGVVVIPVAEDNAPVDGDADGDASVKGIGLISSGGQMKQHFLRAVHAGVISRRSGHVSGREDHDHGGIDDDNDVRNVQINNPTLDHTTTFDPAVINTRPFEFST